MAKDNRDRAMYTQYYKCTLLGAYGLLALLIASVCWLSWREIQQQKLNKALIAAIEQADVKTTINLLNRGADPNISDAPQSETSLWRSIWDRMRGVAIGTAAGTPALLFAVNLPCENPNIGGQSYQASIVTALLDHGADVRRKDRDGFDVVYDSILCAYDDQTLGLLIRHHTEVNLHSPAGGRTPLMNAAGCGTPGAIRLLLDSGARINDRDEEARRARPTFALIVQN